MSELNLSSKQLIGVYKIDNTKKTLKWYFLLIYNFFSLQEILSRYKVFRDIMKISNLRFLENIEEIKKLKYFYFQTCDTNNLIQIKKYLHLGIFL